MRPSYYYQPWQWDDEDVYDGLFSLPKHLLSLRLLEPLAASSSKCGDVPLSSVAKKSDKFQVSMDVNHFSPNELSIKTVDNTVVVHGKHEERRDEQGYVSREFTRRYVLPDDVDPAQVVSSLSRDGVLTIEASLKPKEEPKPNERVVEIVQKPPPTNINKPSVN